MLKAVVGLVRPSGRSWQALLPGPALALAATNHRPRDFSEELVYDFVLTLHNYLRWALLLVGLAALVLAWSGAASRGRWTPPQVNLGRLFTGLFDLQVLVGVLLYAVLSPLTTGAFKNMGAAMKNPDLRFYVAEHLVGMLIAAVLVHIGAARAKRKDSPLQAAIFYTLAFVVVIVSIPWERPLF